MNLYFFNESGQCVRKVTLSASEDAAAAQANHLRHLAPGTQCVPHPHDMALRDAWFDGSAIRTKTASPVWYDSAAKTLRALPVPCTVHIDDTAYACSDTTAELDMPAGHYRVRVVAAPHHDFTAEIDV